MLTATHRQMLVAVALGAVALVVLPVLAHAQGVTVGIGGGPFEDMTNRVTTMVINVSRILAVAACAWCGWNLWFSSHNSVGHVAGFIGGLGFAVFAPQIVAMLT